MSDLSFIALGTARRWDIYGPIHKGLRAAHADMVVRLGRAEFSIHGQPELMADLRRHLVLCSQHLAHEEAHLHPALEARRPGVTAALEAQHDHHHARLEMLASAVRAVDVAGPADRPGLGRALYIAFTGFVAEDLEHMQREETQTWPQLCELFTDDELMAIEMAIVGSLTPEDHTAFLRLMLPAMNPEERRSLLGGIKANAPADVYAAVIEQAARPTLPAHEFAELQRLGLAA